MLRGLLAFKIRDNQKLCRKDFFGIKVFRRNPFLAESVLFIKFRVKCIEVFAVQLFLDDSQAFAETLVVYDLALS